MKEKTIYLISPNISFKTFKLLQKALVKDDGPAPKHIEKVLWDMMRSKKIYCWFSPDLPNDMGISLKLPIKKGYATMVIRDAKSPALDKKAGK